MEVSTTRGLDRIAITDFSRILDGFASKDSLLIVSLRRYTWSARTLSCANNAGGFLGYSAERFNVARKLINAAMRGALTVS